MESLLMQHKYLFFILILLFLFWMKSWIIKWYSHMSIYSKKYFYLDFSRILVALRATCVHGFMWNCLCIMFGSLDSSQIGSSFWAILVDISVCNRVQGGLRVKNLFIVTYSLRFSNIFNLLFKDILLTNID